MALKKVDQNKTRRWKLYETQNKAKANENLIKLKSQNVLIGRYWMKVTSSGHCITA